MSPHDPTRFIAPITIRHAVTLRKWRSVLFVFFTTSFCLFTLSCARLDLQSRSQPVINDLFMYFRFRGVEERVLLQCFVVGQRTMNSLPTILDARAAYDAIVGVLRLLLLFVLANVCCTIGLTRQFNASFATWRTDPRMT